MGPLEPLLDDPEVTRIFIPKPQVVSVERRGKTEHVDGGFVDESADRLSVSEQRWDKL